MNAAIEPATTPEVSPQPEPHAHQDLPPEIAKLLDNIGHALAQAPKALLLVNEEADVISPFLEAYLADSLRQACPGRKVALFQPKHELGPTAALAEALAEFIPGLTPELFLGMAPDRRLSFVRMMLGKETQTKEERNAPASHILIVDRLDDARSGQHDDRADFCNLIDTLAQETWFGCAIAMGSETGEVCEKAAGLSALLRQSSRVDLQNGKFKLAGRGKSGETRFRQPRTDRPTAKPALWPMAMSAVGGTIVTAAVFLGGAHFFNVDWRTPLGMHSEAANDGPSTAELSLVDSASAGDQATEPNADGESVAGD